MKRLNITREVINKLLPYVEGRVLDLGAGSAKYKDILLKKATDYVACDVQYNKNINVICDVANLVFPAESFDTVISTQVLEHVKNPFVVVSEIKKVLKPGGCAIITVPFMIPYHPDPHDNFRFSKEGLETLVKSQNFEVVESGIYGGIFMVFSAMIQFSWFNPYKHKSGRVMAFIEKIAKSLDKIFVTKTIYANSFIVAKKK